VSEREGAPAGPQAIGALRERLNLSQRQSGDHPEVRVTRWSHKHITTPEIIAFLEW
jgi:hypothetical protein